SSPLTSTRWEPERRISTHPSRFNAARTRPALATPRTVKRRADSAGSASARDLDDGGGGGLDGQADARARVGGEGVPCAGPGGVAGDGGAAECGRVPPGVSRLPAGQGYHLRALHSWAGRDDRDGGIGGTGAVCLVDDRDVIGARPADAIGGQ